MYVGYLIIIYKPRNREHNSVAKMNYQKIISTIATAFGITFIIFAVITALLTYTQISIQYGSTIPAEIVWLNVLNEILPLSMFAVLSLIIAFFTKQKTNQSELYNTENLYDQDKLNQENQNDNE